MRVTTSTLAASVSSPPYCASMTSRAASGPFPAPSMRRTAASLQAGTRSPGLGVHLVTAGSAGAEGEWLGSGVLDGEGGAEEDA